MIKRDNIHRLVRALLRTWADGLTVADIATELDKPPQNIRTALRAMPDVYIDRWEPAAGIGRALRRGLVRRRDPTQLPEANEMSNSPKMNYGATRTPYTPALGWIGPDKVGHFLKLFSVVAAKVGGVAAAARFADVSESSLALARQRREMTDKQARKILAAYKRAKSL